MKHYANTEQITKTIKYEFKLPKFGKSTTDPTYYEPSATRIANMKKSASPGPNLYDFDGSDLPKIKDKTGKEYPDWSKQDISKSRITPGRKPGMTREEISQRYQESVSDIEKYNEEQKQEQKELQKQIENSKQTLKALNETSENPANAE